MDTTIITGILQSSFSPVTLFPVSLVKYHSTNEAGTENKNGASHNEEETMEQILRQEKSAAGILCQLNSQHASQALNSAFSKDVLGIVANLARVDDDNLSRSVFLILQIFLLGVRLWLGSTQNSQMIVLKVFLAKSPN